MHLLIATIFDMDTALECLQPAQAMLDGLTHGEEDEQLGDQTMVFRGLGQV
jgi:hypothetical protein